MYGHSPVGGLSWAATGGRPYNRMKNIKGAQAEGHLPLWAPFNGSHSCNIRNRPIAGVNYFSGRPSQLSQKLTTFSASGENSSLSSRDRCFSELDLGISFTSWK